MVRTATSKTGTTRGLVTLLLVGALLGALAAPAAAHRGRHKRHVDRQPIELEFDDVGDIVDGDEFEGSSRLRRRDNSLHAKVRINGLQPGGVYTFWWHVTQGEGVFPQDHFVANGGAVIVGRNGKARVHMAAYVGQPGIEGFPVTEGAPFAALHDTRDSHVLVEIAYHGQAEDAGDDLGQWMTDFWTGSACPEAGENPFGQPYCPVVMGAEHEA